MEHTKGEWKYKDVPHAGLEIYAKMTQFPEFKQPISFFLMPSNKDIRFCLNDKGELWGCIAYESWRQFSDKKWENVQEANARLIAAAPDLLAACKDAVIQMKLILPLLNDVNPEAAAALDHLIAIKYKPAIAKAESE